MNEKTRSEIYVENLCRMSFLNLFTHPNPIGRNGKELCDCLVVCGDKIVIISVKEIDFKDTGDGTGVKRWMKSAIDKSIRQIYGAERWIRKSNTIIRNDGRQITLPDKEKRKYHRIAVSLGSKRNITFMTEFDKNKYVHILDEFSVGVIFEMFDTITDFVGFLEVLEDVQEEKNMLIVEGGVEDLVALYLSNGNSFDFYDERGNKADLIVVADDLWKNFSKSEDFQYIMQENEKSYLWDGMIEFYTKDLLGKRMFNMHSMEVTDNELAFIEMALQPRIHRRVLSEAYEDFMKIENRQIRSRIVKGYNNTAFVFLVGSSAERRSRGHELILRCHVIRGVVGGVTKVVGIATDRPGTSEVGYSSDIVYMYMPDWTEKDEKKMKRIQEEFGYFKNIVMRKEV